MDAEYAFSERMESLGAYGVPNNNAVCATGPMGRAVLVAFVSLIAAALCLLVACAPQQKVPGSDASATEASGAGEALVSSDDEIIDAAVENFMLLAEVPRPSHHEEKISAFLMDWAKGLG